MATYKFQLIDLADPGGAGNAHRESGSGAPIKTIRVEYNSAEVATALARSGFASLVTTIEAG